jgi:Replication-relaxation
MMPKKPLPFTIGDADTAILLALNRLIYLTAAQTSRLLYPKLKDNNRYATRRLKRLVDTGYVLRLGNLPTPRYGSAPHVFSLARKGRQYVSGLGTETLAYFRPSEEAEKAFNRPYMQHTLCAIDVLIAAELLGKESGISLSRLVNERELKRMAVRVDVGPSGGSVSPMSRSVAVIPDGWFQLKVGSESPRSIALELDRGTEEQKFFRRKVAALSVWANGPYRDVFETDNITIAVVAPNEVRRDKLRAWTARELASRGRSEDEEIFLFTSADPIAQSPRSFFFDPLWYLPSDKLPLALVDVSEDQREGAHTLYA